MDWVLSPESWIALATLTALEIVLGIDNIVFISILAGKLPGKQQGPARLIGLGLAMITRVGLLFSLTWLMGITTPLFSAFTNEISGRDLILIAGGLFLLGKSTVEIHEKLEGKGSEDRGKAQVLFAAVIFQIVLLDLVFSLDSVITAVGMAQQIGIMVAAIVIAVVFMMISAAGISSFIQQHPTIKMLALSFLILIGVALIAEGLELHIPKGYIYFAMAFSVFVEMLNLRVRKRVSSPKGRSLSTERSQ